MSDRDAALFEDRTVPIAVRNRDHFMLDVRWPIDEAVQQRLRTPKLEPADDVEDAKAHRYSPSLPSSGPALPFDAESPLSPEFKRTLEGFL